MLSKKQNKKKKKQNKKKTKNKKNKNKNKNKKKKTKKQKKDIVEWSLHSRYRENDSFWDVSQSVLAQKYDGIMWWEKQTSTSGKQMVICCSWHLLLASWSMAHYFCTHARTLTHVMLSSLHEVPKDFERDFILPSNVSHHCTTLLTHCWESLHTQLKLSHMYTLHNIPILNRLFTYAKNITSNNHYW